MIEPMTTTTRSTSTTDCALSVVCDDAEATRRLGAALGGLAQPGAVVLLQGDLGAGKTVFAQGVGRGLDVPSVVNSPTFVLMNEHLGGRLPLRHADLYRLDDPSQSAELIAELGLAQAAEDGVLLVEWPERAPQTGEGSLPDDHLLVVLEASDWSEDAQDASPRTVRLTASGEASASLLAALRSAAAAE